MNNKMKSPSEEGRKVNYYSERCRSNITCDDIKKYLDKNEQKLQELIKHKTFEEKCKIASDLNLHLWDENELGTFQNALVGSSLYWLLVSKIGSYQIYKYEYLHNGGSKEAFFEMVLESCYNLLNPPLQ